MILIGDKNIPYENIFKIDSIENIVNTPSNSTIIFEYKQELMHYCNKNSLKYAVLVTDLKEAIYANALDAKYIICQKELAKKIQKVADNYMFDAKVLAVISSNDEFNEIIDNEIDGIIYDFLIKK